MTTDRKVLRTHLAICGASSPAGLMSALLAGMMFAGAAPAIAQDMPLPQDAPAANVAAHGDEPAAASGSTSAMSVQEEDNGGETDILSRRTISVLLDARLSLANGSTSWVDGGLGKTRFGGTRSGDFKLRAVPVEAAVVWTPRFTRSLSANVSGAWQRDQQHGFDLIEAFVNYLPEQDGKVNFSGRAGLMWPEISLEHSTGGAWSVVNTITPSAINSWVGEETKVLGLEGTVHASFGKHDVSLTGGAFGYNDTAGTLLTFRGWALHDLKATAFGHLPLPPRNGFMTFAQAGKTKSSIELDDRIGFYGRLAWQPPVPIGIAVFYYDNRGKPTAVNSELQWGWRTRFWNVGVNANLGPNTKLLAQGMSGSTIMGFEQGGVNWAHTYFRSAFVLITQDLGSGTAITGRVEAFGTREHGSVMSPDNSEDGWALTAAVRHTFSPHVTGFVEALHVSSTRGVRLDLVGVAPKEEQTVMQASVRLRL